MMTTEQPPQVEPTVFPGFVRPLQGRLFAGVAAGIAQKSGIPLWLVRVLFVIAATMGGVGIVAYLAGWLLIPAAVFLVWALAGMIRQGRHRI